MNKSQQFEIPSKSREPQNVEDLLENGEIKSVKELQGYWGMQLVEIKDDGDALFRPDDTTDFMFEAKGMEARRSDLELMAYQIDKILGFNLVPAVTNRAVGNRKGSLQRQIKNFHSAFGVKWENEVRPEDIIRAAIFDYLFDVKDRHMGNFIIDSDTGKIWLIDHDFLMFFGELTRTRIVDKAKEMDLLVLNGAENASLERFLAHADSLVKDAKPEVAEIIKKAQERAKILLEQNQIPASQTPNI